MLAITDLAKCKWWCSKKWVVSYKLQVLRPSTHWSHCWRNSSSSPRLTSCEKDNCWRERIFWVFWVDCSPRHHTLSTTLFNVHRVRISTLFSELADYLESIVICQEQLLISGDFNIHLDNAVDTDAIKLMDLLESYGLQQHVTSPTRKRDHTHDLIITRQSDQLLENKPRIS